MDNNKYIIISFNTTTDAMAFEKFCIGNKIGGKLISVPKEIDSGCGLAWEIKIDYDNIKNEKVENEKLHLKDDKVDKTESERDKIEISKLNEVKEMVKNNNLKCDKIVIFEKRK